jgi:hypothetical protein
MRQWRSVRPVESPSCAPFIAADLGHPPGQLNCGSIVIRQATGGVGGVNGSGQRIEEFAARQLSSQLPLHLSSIGEMFSIHTDLSKGEIQARVLALRWRQTVSVAECCQVS